MSNRSFLGLTLADGGHKNFFGHMPIIFALNVNDTSDEKESDMEKIAITSEGPTLDDALDPRFGRAAGFIVVDPHTLKFDYVDNGASQAMAQGAGIQAAETIARAGANVLLTGYVGPKAFVALQAAGIKVGQNLENLTVRQVVEKYNCGEVEWADAPNRTGHGR
jgi:predicted Fe-Mo cluster-binding NifX family protein